MIDSYSFGSITVDGTRYDKDVIVTASGVLSPWWRREGHSLCPEDLDTAVSSKPEVLVIGTGSFGVMKVPEATITFLKGKGIEARVMRTGKAVEEFNRHAGQHGPREGGGRASPYLLRLYPLII